MDEKLSPDETRRRQLLKRTIDFSKPDITARKRAFFSDDGRRTRKPGNNRKIMSSTSNFTLA
jgi:hypothetical protein